MKSRFLLGTVIVGLALPSWSMPQSSYDYVMKIVQARDLPALQRMVNSGLNLNSPAADGMTPLCETIEQQDYQGYEMLLSQGATPYVPCMRQLPASTVQTFYANQPPAHTYYEGSMMKAHDVSDTSRPSLGIPLPNAGEILLGGLATGIAFAVNNSGKSKKVSPVVYKWDAPLDLDPSTFSSTAEYKAEKTGWQGSINFLSDINASGAYKRGYTGYKVKREKDGTLIGSGESAISTSPVKVAVIDDGIWAGHPEFDTTGKILPGYNGVYGVCADEQTTGKCWKWSGLEEFSNLSSLTNDFGVAQLYENGVPVEGHKTVVSRLDWLMYKTNNTTYSASDTTPVISKIWEDDTSNPSTYDTFKDSEGSWWVVKRDSSGNPSAGPYKVTCPDSGTTGCYWTDSGSTKHYLVLKNQYEYHGSVVAGLIGAQRNDEGMMGVAYNASLIPIKLDETMEEQLSLLPQAINAGADIVNFSTASLAPLHEEEGLISRFNYRMQRLPAELTGLRAAAKSNTIVVVAAGNYLDSTHTDTPYDPSVVAVAPLSDYFNGKTPDEDGVTYNLKNLFVNVVSVNYVNANYQLSSYSAKCGITKDYCIAAPGGDGAEGDWMWGPTYGYSQGSSTAGYTYVGSSGTSFAAPIVSGALAVIKGAFPHLTNQQVVQILLETATDLGAPGVDEIYGHGLVNLEAATSPIGLPQISLTSAASGGAIPAASSSVYVPASLGAMKAALPSKMIVLDKYSRAFQIPTASFVRVSKRQNKLEGRFHSFVSGDDKVVQNDVFQMSYSERHSKLNSSMQQGAVNMLFKPSDKFSLKAFYSENTETSGGKYFDRLLASPYGHMKEAWGGGFSMALGSHLQAEMFGQVGQNGYVEEDDLKRMDRNKMSLFQSSLMYKGLGPISLKTVAGISKEQGSVLGMWGRGAFKSGNSNTAYVGAGMTINLTDDFVLDGMYYYGKTQVSKQTALLKLSNLTSDSFALTASWHMDEKRMIGLQFVSPLKIRQGTAEVDLPIARDAYRDVVYRQKTKASLRPTAREYDVGLYYADALSDAMLFQTEMGVRLNPDHVSGVAPDWRALVGLSMDM